MRTFLSVLLPILTAQLFGVALAWGANAMSWNYHRDGRKVFSSSCVKWINWASLPFVVIFFSVLPLTNAIIVFAATSTWLLVVALVQKQQLKIGLSAAFYEVLMQFFCFGWALFLFGLIFIAPARLLPNWLALVWFASATLTYALLSLFRPTIWAMVNALRQSFRNNRPLR